MRKTYAYNGITIGILLGIGAWASTSNAAVGIGVTIGASILGFIIIRAIENAIYKGTEMAGEAISRKLDEAHRNRNRNQV